jgi:hypothetical protein
MGGGLRWLSTRTAVLVFSVGLGCYLLDAVQPVVAGALSGSTGSGPVLALNEAVRFASVVLGVLAMLAIASAAAASMTGEREQDTWISLATTLLSPFEIIRAKQLGCLWGCRRLALALGVSWITGWLLGALDSLGMIGALALVAASGWFVAAAGVFVSTGARNTTRALVATVLVALVAGWSWPWMVWSSLISQVDLDAMRRALGRASAFGSGDTFSYLVGLGVAVAAYAGAAGVLTLWSVHRLRRRWCRF